MGKVLGVIFMNKKKEKTQEKKLEGVIVKPGESRDLIKKNLMEMFKKQGIKVKKVVANKFVLGILKIR